MPPYDDRLFAPPAPGQLLVIDQEVGILGRNILNTVALLLDGPQQTWGEQRVTSR